MNRWNNTIKEGEEEGKSSQLVHTPCCWPERVLRRPDKHVVAEHCRKE